MKTQKTETIDGNWKLIKMYVDFAHTAYSNSKFNMSAPERPLKGRGYERVEVKLNDRFFKQFTNFLPSSHFNTVATSKSGGYYHFVHIITPQALAFFNCLKSQPNNMKITREFAAVLKLGAVNCAGS